MAHPSNIHPNPPTFRTHIGIWDDDGGAIFMRGPSGRSDLRSYAAIVLPIAEYERLRDALDSLAHEAREFSTRAAYTVAEGTEEEFVAALATAEALLATGVLVP